MSIVTQGYGDDSGPSPSPTDDVPLITIVSPTPGSPLTQYTPVVIQVTDTVPLARVFVYAYSSSSSLWEVVHDGSSFSPNFSGGVNTRTILTNGYQYTLLRNGGWKGSPTVHVYAVNTDGYVSGV